MKIYNKYKKVKNKIQKHMKIYILRKTNNKSKLKILMMIK